MEKKTFSLLLFISGLALFALNTFGLFQDIRAQSITNENLRFPNDQPVPYQWTFDKLKKQNEESDIEFSERATKVISRGLAHIHWDIYPPQYFNQLIPVWENYFLYFMGRFSGIPEFERYHFADYRRSLKRGIGICGDASMVLSQVLTINNIKNKILTYPGHVVVSADFSNGTSQILDADFGVSIPFSKIDAVKNNEIIAKLYTSQGYTEKDEVFFQKMYQEDYLEWDGVKHFITKKYYFEMFSYWLKWLLPILMILIAGYIRKPSRILNP